MFQHIPAHGLQLRSLIAPEGELRLSLVETPVAPPAKSQVLVRIEAAPINPSDLGLLVGPADLATVQTAGGDIVASIPPARMGAVAARVGQSLPVGNEGAGTVIAAGPDPAAQALIGSVVAMIGGAMYGEYRTLDLADVLPLRAGTTPADGASCFVNPLTALGMVETMRMESHSALVHTAAASNLGQMLQKVCLKDGIGLVNIVRDAAQAKLLKDIGGTHVLDSTSPDFLAELAAALSATGATLAFDAIGGGDLASQILAGMEQAQVARGGAYSAYGSRAHKQVYLYGGLSPAPTRLVRSYGLAWSIGGWLLWPFLERIGPTAATRLRRRVADELKTTFASRYSAEISLREALQPDMIAAYARRATGEKYLINPAKA